MMPPTHLILGESIFERELSEHKERNRGVKRLKKTTRALLLRVGALEVFQGMESHMKWAADVRNRIYKAQGVGYSKYPEINIPPERVFKIFQEKINGKSKIFIMRLL